MGLDLLVFGGDPENEIDGVRVGLSSDFDRFRHVVRKQLDRRLRSTRFPILMRDDAWDASWDASDAVDLERELSVIASEFSKLPPEPQPGVWSESANQQRNSDATSLLESFVTIDGELFVLTFLRYARLAQERNGYVRTN